MAQALFTTQELMSGMTKAQAETLEEVLQFTRELGEEFPSLVEGKDPQTEVEVWEARWQKLEAHLEQRLRDVAPEQIVKPRPSKPDRRKLKPGDGQFLPYV